CSRNRSTCVSVRLFSSGTLTRGIATAGIMRVSPVSLESSSDASTSRTLEPANMGLEAAFAAPGRGAGAGCEATSAGLRAGCDGVFPALVAPLAALVAALAALEAPLAAVGATLLARLGAAARACPAE